MVAATLSIAAGAWVAFGTSGTAFAFANPLCASSAYAQTCLRISGYSLGTPSYGTFTASAAARIPETIQTCINYNGASLGCTGFRALSPGQTIAFAAGRFGIAGAWCANTWLFNPHAATTEVGHVCINVTTTIE